MTTRLLLLGRPYAEAGGRRVELAAKAAALLGYLALSREAPPRERVLGLLWGESPEDAARKNLRNTLWTLRRELGGETVVTTGDRLALDPGLAVDVTRLLAAEPADEPGAGAELLDLYRGPFLDGLALGEAPEFELWLVSARQRVADAFLARASAMVNSLVAASAALPGAASSAAAAPAAAAVRLARGALAHDPLHEGLNRALMAALAAAGERSEALRQFETFKAQLERELGVPPDTETLRLREVLAQPVDAAAGRPLPAPGRRAPRAAVRRPRPPEPIADEPAFVGRAAERAELDAELARATAGQARVVVLTGELGIGKSRLWREWLAGLTLACTALEARCVEAASNLPFTPLVELFGSHPCVEELFHPTPDAPAALPLPWLAEVSRLLPQVRSAAPGLPAPAALPPEEERRRVFEAFVQVLLALDAHPLLIFVDDVHWADRATLDWLPYLVHRMRHAPLLLVLAFRPEEAPAGLVHQVAAWGREGVLRRIPLARLAPQETARLLQELQVDSGLTEMLHAQSAGNPYFLLELSRNLQATTGDRVPAGLAELVASRIDRLSAEGRAVLQAAGVLEPEFDAALLTQTTGLSEDAVLDALDELLTGRLLIERGPGVAFNHPLLSRVVRDRLSAARRRVLHRRAAQALQVRHGDALGPVAGLIADHYAAAGEDGLAAASADLAAEHAQSLAAGAEAVAFRRRAWTLAPTPPRGLALAAALWRTGALQEAREAYQAALAAAEAAGDAKTASRACLGLGVTYLPVGQIDQVQQWTERSLAYQDVAADPWAHAYAHFLLGAGKLRAGGPALEAAEVDLAEAIELAARHEVREVALVARFELGNARAERGDLAGALAMYAETAGLAAAGHEPNQQVLALNNLAYHTMLTGDVPAARGLIEDGMRLAEQYGLGMAREYLLSTRAEIELADGRWDAAEAFVQASLAEAQVHNNVAHIAKCRANLGLVARGRGDQDSALILLEEAAGLAAPLTARYLQAQIDLWLTEVYLARGETAAAAATLGEATRRLEGSHYRGLLERAAALAATLDEGGTG